MGKRVYDLTSQSYGPGPTFSPLYHDKMCSLVGCYVTWNPIPVDQAFRKFPHGGASLWERKQTPPGISVYSCLQLLEFPRWENPNGVSLLPSGQWVSLMNTAITRG